MLSGRWDESNQMRDGRVVIEGRDPKIFKYVIEFLKNGHKYPQEEDEKLSTAIKEEFQHWGIEGEYVWKPGQAFDDKTVWYSEIQMDLLKDPTKESILNLKGKIHLTDNFEGCLIEVMIFVWSKNNPERKFQWIDVHMTCLEGEKETIELDEEISLTDDKDYNNGIQLYLCECLHYSFEQAHEDLENKLKNNGWIPSTGLNSGQLIAEWAPEF